MSDYVDLSMDDIIEILINKLSTRVVLDKKVHTCGPMQRDMYMRASKKLGLDICDMLDRYDLDQWYVQYMSTGVSDMALATKEGSNE